MSSVTEAPSLFLRNATGLVKGWSGFDAFGYSFLSVNLVTLGMFYSLAVFAFVPDGSVLSALLLSGIVMTFLCVTYAGLIAVMPRAGGDYVWQTRILDGAPGLVLGAVVGGITVYLVGPGLRGGARAPSSAASSASSAVAALGWKRGGIGFVLSATGWWFILALWAPIYGYILNIEVVQPLVAIAGWTDGADVLRLRQRSVHGLAVHDRARLGRGRPGHGRLRPRPAVVHLDRPDPSGRDVRPDAGVVAGLFQTAFDREASSLFGVKDAYNQTIVNATANDGFVAGGSPLNFGLSSGHLPASAVHDVLDPLPELGRDPVRRGPRGGRLPEGPPGHARRPVGDDRAGNRLRPPGVQDVRLGLLQCRPTSNFINYAYGYVTMAPTIPIWGYPPMLAAFLIDNHIVQMAIVILFGAWFIGWAGTLWLSSTRMIFAAAFDRVLPEAAARVDDRGVPWIALLLIMIPGVVLSWLYAYQAGFSALTLDASLVIAVTFFGTSFAATILPWWKRDLYLKSPIARYQVAGVPMISVAGAITTIFLGWVVYQWLGNSLYGIGTGNTKSIQFLGIVYGLAALVWVLARVYRRSQGVDLDAIHAEIPSE